MTTPDRSKEPGPRTARPSEKLKAAQDQFIGAWGQMGSAWGISRTMAEVHALLFISGEPLCTDDIMERLAISRGNASMSLRSLLEWGIVTRSHKRGDRKEYFQAEQDVWTLFRAIVRERIKREIDPLLAQLYEIRDMTSTARVGKPAAEERHAIEDHNARLEEMLAFFRTLESLSTRFVSPPGRGLKLAASLLNRLPEPKAEAS
jgi:DNA-binding transcriptional regulator GbsR (MarR family)